MQRMHTFVQYFHICLLSSFKCAKVQKKLGLLIHEVKSWSFIVHCMGRAGHPSVQEMQSVCFQTGCHTLIQMNHVYKANGRHYSG